jgi:hypothetical protein
MSRLYNDLHLVFGFSNVGDDMAKTLLCRGEHTEPNDGNLLASQVLIPDRSLGTEESCDQVPPSGCCCWRLAKNRSTDALPAEKCIVLAGCRIIHTTVKPKESTCLKAKDTHKPTA